MAVSVITTPRKNISGFDSDAASTTQLLYKFNENTITPGEAYVLQVVVPELSNLTRYYVPQANGDIEFNIGPTIESALFAAGLTNIEYTIDYSSVRNGVETAEGSTTSILAVISKMQILSEYGANLYNYVAQSAHPGLFLTNFEKPKFWEGWAKSAYWINQDLTLTYDIIETVQDANGTDLGFTAYTQAPILMNVESWALTYPAEVNQSQLRLYVQSGLKVMEFLFYSLQPECKEPVMLEWLNSLGGYDTYLFSYEQTITNIQEEGRKWQRPIAEDIANIRTTKGRYAPKTTQYMTLKTAFLNMNEVQTLHEIKGSEDIRLWINKDGSEYVGVTVNTGYTTDYTTGKGNYEFSLNIELPDNFDFFKAKLY